MVENPVFGQKYWSIKASIETENYYGLGECEPSEPWQGILKSWDDRTGQSPWALHHFGECYPDGDDDSNATALVEPKDLYLTRQEAVVAFCEAAEQFAEFLVARGQRLMDRCHELLAEAFPDKPLKPLL